jgi:hypothetical protein
LAAQSERVDGDSIEVVHSLWVTDERPERKFRVGMFRRVSGGWRMGCLDQPTRPCTS